MAAHLLIVYTVPKNTAEFDRAYREEHLPYAGPRLVGATPENGRKLVVSIALGLSSLLSFAMGVLLDSIRNHSKQFYELALTSYREVDALRERD